MHSSSARVIGTCYQALVISTCHRLVLSGTRHQHVSSARVIRHSSSARVLGTCYQAHEELTSQPNGACTSAQFTFATLCKFTKNHFRVIEVVAHMTKNNFNILLIVQILLKKCVYRPLQLFKMRELCPSTPYMLTGPTARHGSPAPPASTEVPTPPTPPAPPASPPSPAGAQRMLL